MNMQIDAEYNAPPVHNIIHDPLFYVTYVFRTMYRIKICSHKWLFVDIFLNFLLFIHIVLYFTLLFFFFLLIVFAIWNARWCMAWTLPLFLIFDLLSMNMNNEEKLKTRFTTSLPSLLRQRDDSNTSWKESTVLFIGLNSKNAHI